MTNDNFLQPPAQSADLISLEKRTALSTALDFAKHVKKNILKNGEYAPLITMDVDTVISVCHAALQSSQLVEPVGEVYRRGMDKDGNGPREGVRMLAAGEHLPHGTKLFTSPDPMQPIMPNSISMQAVLRESGCYEGSDGFQVAYDDIEKLDEIVLAKSAPMVDAVTHLTNRWERLDCPACGGEYYTQKPKPDLVVAGQPIACPVSAMQEYVNAATAEGMDQATAERIMAAMRDATDLGYFRASDDAVSAATDDESLVQQLSARNASLQAKCNELEQLCDETYVAQGADAYNHSCETMSQWQRDRRKKGKPVGTEGSLCDGISWLYMHIESLEEQQAKREIEPADRRAQQGDKLDAIQGALALEHGFRWRLQSRGPDWHYVWHRAPDSWELQEAEIQSVVVYPNGAMTAQPKLAMPVDDIELPPLVGFAAGHGNDWTLERTFHEFAKETVRVDRERAQRAGSEDTCRLNWLGEDAGECVVKVGKQWYTRQSHGMPHRKADNLRAAIDSARHKEQVPEKRSKR